VRVSRIYTDDAGKLLVDSAGAVHVESCGEPPCCAGGEFACGIPSPLCATLLGGTDVCDTDFDLGGVFRVTLRMNAFSASGSSTARYYVSDFLLWVTLIRSWSISLIQPIVQTFTVLYCNETGNWILCREAGAGGAASASWRYEQGSCSGVNSGCVPVMGSSNPNYTLEQGVANILPSPVAGSLAWSPLPSGVCNEPGASLSSTFFAVNKIGLGRGFFHQMRG